MEASRKLHVMWAANRASWPRPGFDRRPGALIKKSSAAVLRMLLLDLDIAGRLERTAAAGFAELEAWRAPGRK
jgi:hypothetical protein